MITYFTEQDIVSFGNYLLSDERLTVYKKYNIEEDKIPEALKVVNPIDLTGWIELLQEIKRKVEQENSVKQEMPEPDGTHRY